jgi:hypothetical protein
LGLPSGGEHGEVVGELPDRALHRCAPGGPVRRVDPLLRVAVAGLQPDPPAQHIRHRPGIGIVEADGSGADCGGEDGFGVVSGELGRPHRPDALLPVEPVEPEEPIPATATVMVSMSARPNEPFVHRPWGSRG